MSVYHWWRRAFLGTKVELLEHRKITVTRKRGGGAHDVAIKLNGMIINFGNEDSFVIEADPGRYKVIIAVLGPRGATGEVSFAANGGVIYNLACEVENDHGIDHSDGEFTL